MRASSRKLPFDTILELHNRGTSELIKHLDFVKIQGMNWNQK